MEVHHHPIAIGSHTARKKWTHYFWEFLMLFLDRESIINMLGFIGMSGIRPTRQQHFQRYIDLNADLFKELRKEYNLK